MKSITFDSSSKEFILNAFNKGIDSDGFIVDKTNENKRVPAIDGSDITIDDFAGVAKGSEVYVKSDIGSLIELCDRLKR